MDAPYGLIARIQEAYDVVIHIGNLDVFGKSNRVVKLAVVERFDGIGATASCFGFVYHVFLNAAVDVVDRIALNAGNDLVVFPGIIASLTRGVVWIIRHAYFFDNRIHGISGFFCCGLLLFLRLLAGRPNVCVHVVRCVSHGSCQGKRKRNDKNLR